MRNYKLVTSSIAVLSLLLLSGATGVLAAGTSNVTIINGSGTSFKHITTVHPSAFSQVSRVGRFTFSPTQGVIPSPVAGSSQSTQLPLKTSKPTAPPNGNTPTAEVLALPNVAPSTVVTPSLTSGLVTAQGLNIRDERLVNGFTLEPPDQGLCVGSGLGSGYVLETVNTEFRVFTTSFASFSSDVSLAALLPAPWNGLSQSDPRCLYDTQTGHWFITWLMYDLDGTNPATTDYNHCINDNTPSYLNCFSSWLAIAVSSTALPYGSWNIYLLDVTNDGNGYTTLEDPGCPCLADQPLLGANGDLLVLSTNEFPWFPGGFNGGTVYMFDKQGLALGFVDLNEVSFPAGLEVPTPEWSYYDTSCTDSGGAFCWYSINPATSPDATQYDTSAGGTQYFLSSLDFIGSPDNRIAAWSITGTSNIRSYFCSTCDSMGVNLALATGVETYYDPYYQLASQKAGPIPRGDNPNNFGFGGLINGCDGACPEQGLATNGDGMFDNVVYSKGALWGGINTIVNQLPGVNHHIGIAYWIVGASASVFTLKDQGYISASGADVFFPAFGVGPTGNALITFTLSGTGYYPTTAYAKVNIGSHGALNSKVYLADKGQAPQDGFTQYEYLYTDGPWRPRWGDYSFAVWANGKVYFATEYIASPACSDGFFTIDPSCGGTRVLNGNWATSLNSISP